ncbi:MAG: hypothetical protein AAB885_01195 [Patescibacteria group bacterium]
MYDNNRFRWSRILFFGILLVAIAFLQSNNFLIFGVKPNLILVALIVFSFLVTDFASYAVLILLTLVMMRSRPGWDLSLVSLGLVGIGSWFVKQIMPGRDSLNLAIAIIFSTIIFYGLIDPNFLYSEWLTSVIEAGYNLVAGFILYYTLKRNV